MANVSDVGNNGAAARGPLACGPLFVGVSGSDYRLNRCLCLKLYNVEMYEAQAVYSIFVAVPILVQPTLPKWLEHSPRDQL